MEVNEIEMRRETSRLLLFLLKKGGQHFIDTRWGSVAQDRVHEEHGRIYSYKLGADPDIKYDMLAYTRSDVMRAYTDDQGIVHVTLGHLC
jgi:hypothetical protein